MNVSCEILIRTNDLLIDCLRNLSLVLMCFLGIDCHVALDTRNPGPEYNTTILRLILGDLYSAYSHRQFYTQPDLYTVGLHYQTITNSVLSRDAVCTIFMMVFGMTRPGRKHTTYFIWPLLMKRNGKTICAGVWKTYLH